MAKRKSKKLVGWTYWNWKSRLLEPPYSFTLGAERLYTADIRVEITQLDDKTIQIRGVGDEEK